MATPVTIGTAGHIDHGKTLLVEQLTGMRADRPFERERGMTIDIGYAEMAGPEGRRIGFVDLPGHERFIRNMVAGATGIDLALIVVAADDGVMPQTREHVEILELLGVRRALVVLNKVDLVDGEMRELAREELREFLAGSAFEGAPVLACSAATGEGVDAVRARLLELVADTARADDPGAFFLAVQRTFAATGFGCIVTGVPAAGRVAPGEELELLPAGRKVRVRAIQVYHEPAEEARAGHRTALNLSGIGHDDVARGMVVAAPGVYGPTRHVAVDLTLLASAKRALKHAVGVRFLSGTLEQMAKVFLFEGKSLSPGERTIVEIRTREPVVVRDGAPFILRTDNAKETIGGGRIAKTLDGPIARRDTASRERWRERVDRFAGDVADLVRFELAHAEAPPNAADIARLCQLDRRAAARVLEGVDGLAQLPGGAYVLASDLDEAVAGARAAIEAMHAEQPLLAALPLAAVRDRAGLSEALMATAVGRLGDAVVVEGRTIRAREHAVELDPELRAAADRVLGCLHEARFAPPARDKLPAAADLAPNTVASALTFLTDRGAVREVAPGLLYATGVLDEGLRLLGRVAAQRGAFEPVDAKAVLGGISRKWLIPLLEFYDRIGATRRDGNARQLTRRGGAMAEAGIDME